MSHFFDVVQGSDSWFDLRKGIPTSSSFDKIITPRTLKPSSQQDAYLAELIGERLSAYGPERPESYLTNPMRHGVVTEEEARRYLALDADIEVTNGGFWLSSCRRWGASPDGTIGTDGLAEIKCPTAKVHTGYLLAGTLPDEYRCQVQGQLFVTGRKYVQFLSYHSGIAPFMLRVERDEKFLTELAVCLELFHERYMKALAKVKAM